MFKRKQPKAKSSEVEAPPKEFKPIYRKRRKGGKRSFPLFLVAPVGTPNADWTTSLEFTSDSPASRYHALGAIRRISRRSALVRSYIQKLRDNVVGRKGPQPTFGNVGNVRDRKKLMDWWKMWATDPSVEGRQSWGSMLRSLVASYAIDGRAFMILRTHMDYMSGAGAMPLAREWLIDEYGHDKQIYSTWNAGIKEAVHGVARSASSGRVEGYIFWGNPTPSDISAANTGYVYKAGYHPTFLPKSQVVDYLTQHSVSDLDAGFGHIAPLIKLLEWIEGIDDATLDSMKTSANKMGFLERDALSDSVPEKEREELPVEFEQNHIEELPIGYRFKDFNPTAPTSEMTEYRREMVKNVAGSMGLDHASLSGDLREVNYSSIRHGATEARDHYRILQDDLERMVCKPVLNFALENAQMFGGLGVSQSSLMQAMMTPWQHRSWSWVDPQKDAAATSMLIAMGIQSPADVAIQLGIDYPQVLAGAAEYKKAMEAEGLTFEDLKAMAGMAVSSASKDYNSEKKNEKV